MEDPLKPFDPRIMENLVQLNELNNRVQSLKIHPNSYDRVVVTGLEAMALQWVVTLLEGSNVKFEIVEK